jgi:hypothetical protein
MQDAALRWLVEILKTLLSENQARWIVIPFYFVAQFIGVCSSVKT